MPLGCMALYMKIIRRNRSMEKVRTFDIFTPSLKTSAFIEASAGTGKTYAIVGMISRLLLEEGLGIGSLCAVTFTRAAASELKIRVRDCLLKIKHAFKKGFMGRRRRIRLWTNGTGVTLRRRWRIRGV